MRGGARRPWPVRLLLLAVVAGFKMGAVRGGGDRCSISSRLQAVGAVAAAEREEEAEAATQIAGPELIQREDSEVLVIVVVVVAAVLVWLWL